MAFIHHDPPPSLAYRPRGQPATTCKLQQQVPSARLRGSRDVADEWEPRSNPPVLIMDKLSCLGAL